MIAILGAGSKVEVHSVLDGLWIGDWHEADADRRILVRADDDFALALGKNLPAEGLGPEPCQHRQVVRVDDDVVNSYRHADSIRGMSCSCTRWRPIMTPTGCALIMPRTGSNVAGPAGFSGHRTVTNLRQVGQTRASRLQAVCPLRGRARPTVPRRGRAS
jgi:hypothetical protein